MSNLHVIHVTSLNECMHVSQVCVVISVIASALLPVYLPLQVPSIRLRSIERYVIIMGYTYIVQLCT